MDRSLTYDYGNVIAMKLTRYERWRHISSGFMLQVMRYNFKWRSVLTSLALISRHSSSSMSSSSSAAIIIWGTGDGVWHFTIDNPIYKVWFYDESFCTVIFWSLLNLHSTDQPNFLNDRCLSVRILQPQFLIGQLSAGKGTGNWDAPLTRWENCQVEQTLKRRRRHCHIQHDSDRFTVSVKECSGADEDISSALCISSVFSCCRASSSS